MKGAFLVLNLKCVYLGVLNLTDMLIACQSLAPGPGVNQRLIQDHSKSQKQSSMASERLEQANIQLYRVLGYLPPLPGTV